ncbi:hypothetical protein EVAR_90697_1 [Eumeta japonica]|uniref:Uncharacterized protein n=1 Tax=Eumeta variegata TaxID=151549 RepID=A0A4C1YVX6_EUMVA|nr:hypothetical protein EVAR_90697_1 [Eumeta japonica]
MSKALKDHEIEAALLRCSISHLIRTNLKMTTNRMRKKLHNATKLKRILEEIDDPGLRVECPSPLPEEELSNGHQVAREIDRGTGRRNGRGIGWVRGRVAGRGSTRYDRRKSRKGGKSPDREDSDSTDENDLAEAQVDLEECF